MARFLVFAILIDFISSLAVAQDNPLDIPISGESSKFRLIGKLNEPLGTVVTVQGIVVEGPFKGYEGGPNLRVQRINGKATQEHIQIRLAPYFDDFGEEGEDGKSLPRLSFGKSYEFEGYETGGFVGVPSKAYQRANRMIQTSGHYFCHQLKVYHGKQIDPIVWSPANFVDRSALIAGRAMNEEKAAVITGKDWKLLVNHKIPWTAEYLGKEVEAYGFIRKSTEGRCYNRSEENQSGSSRRPTRQEKSRFVELPGASMTTGGSTTGALTCMLMG